MTGPTVAVEELRRAALLATRQRSSVSGQMSRSAWRAEVNTIEPPSGDQVGSASMKSLSVIWIGAELSVATTNTCGRRS